MTQRAARKAAAACLARQRHKSFVSSLQDQVSARQSRVNVLRHWHDEVFHVSATNLMNNLACHLSAPRLTQLHRWLVRSSRLTAVVNGDECGSSASCPGPADDALSARADSPSTEVLVSPHTPNEPQKDADIVRAADQAMALDEELSKQVFVTEAAVAAGVMLQEAEAAKAAEQQALQLPDDDEGLAVLHSIELQEVYGDGLSLLLQHLMDSRQSSVQAWLQLKLESERERSMDPTINNTWTNLSTLEEDFVLINNEHIRGSLATVR